MKLILILLALFAATAPAHLECGERPTSTEMDNHTTTVPPTPPFSVPSYLDELVTTCMHLVIHQRTTRANCVLCVMATNIIAIVAAIGLALAAALASAVAATAVVGAITAAVIGAVAATIGGAVATAITLTVAAGRRRRVPLHLPGGARPPWQAARRDAAL